MYRPTGVMTSMVTSFKTDGSVDAAGMARNIDFQRKAGVRTIVVLGGTGEPGALSAQEREHILEVSREAAGDDISVVASALVGDVDVIVADIDAAHRHGAVACMITNPLFVRPSEDDVHRFLSDVASRSKLPLIVFNSPGRTGFTMSSSLIERAVRDIDLLAGIKESSGDLVRFSEVRQRTRPEFACLQGNDALYLPSLALGGDGGILAAAAAFPEHCEGIDRAMRAGDLESARRWHYALMPAVDLLYRASHPAPLKVAIETRGLPAGPTRPPLYGIPEDLIESMRSTTRDVVDRIPEAVRACRAQRYCLP